MSRRFRSGLFSVVVILMGSLLGGLVSPAQPASAAGKDEDEITAGLRSFTSIYRLVEENSAEKLNADKAIYNGAVPGMLRTLDPHSSFFDPRAFQLLREDQRGNYYGVGMQVSANRENKTVVMHPFPGSPAYKAGLRPGDIILQVNDKSTDGLNTTEVADLLKGPRGTPVQISVQREGADKPLVFNLIRDAIARGVVKNPFFLKPGIAYVDIESFNENTSKELEEAIRGLGEQNIKGLILDLRGNPGGLLNEGVAVAGRFLRPKQMVVYHRGRTSPEKSYTANNGSTKWDYPVVVMVDRYSASAAEIVAGALQDHDRGWVVGDNTFGKGLVQTVFPLSENTGLALTTARYYTPSGRLIQRDYSSGSFYEYYYHKDEDKQNLNDAKMTDMGRTVYGGNGIQPDEKFSLKYNRFQTELLRRRAFFDYLPKYFGSHSVSIPKTWDPDLTMLNDFHAWLLKSNVPFTEAEWAENNDWIKIQLKREAFLTAFGLTESTRYAIETDPAVLKAMDSMPKAKELLESARAKQQIVRRDTRQD